MDKNGKTDYDIEADLRRRAKSAGTPINDDSVVQIKRDKTGNPEIGSIKTVFRPPVLESEPIKRHWAYIWVIVIAIVAIAWIFLYAYFSTHQAPYAAPIR